MSRKGEGKGMNRRDFVKATSLAGAAALVGPQILIRKASAKEDKQIVFISEESNPKAIKVYEQINADFKRETGIDVVMEYPGFKNIAKRVATLIAGGTPADIVWYGAGSAMEVALAGQLADVTDVIDEVGGIPENLRMVIDGGDRSIPTSQQFVYNWYRSDLYEKKGLAPMETWEDYIKIVKALNNPPELYGCIIPSAEMGASHILLETAFRTNDVHWFDFDPKTKKYSVGIDKGENKARAVETLEFMHELHKCSPEASNYNWAELMSTFVTGKVANSYYVGARLLEQVQANNAALAPVTKPVAFPKRITDKYFLSVQGFHIHKKANVDASKSYCKFFLGHPAYIKWLHSVPLHIIPASREVLHSKAYQNNPVIQKRMDVLEFLDSIWGKGVPTYYWDGPVLNPLTGLYDNSNLGGWMLAMRNIMNKKSEDIVDEAAAVIRKKMDAKS